MCGARVRAFTPSLSGGACASPQFFLKATQLFELRQEYDSSGATVESVEERIRQAQPHVDAVKQKFKAVKNKYNQFRQVRCWCATWARRSPRGCTWGRCGDSLGVAVVLPRWVPPPVAKTACQLGGLEGQCVAIEQDILWLNTELACVACPPPRARCTPLPAAWVRWRGFYNAR